MANGGFAKVVMRGNTDEQKQQHVASRTVEMLVEASQALIRRQTAASSTASAADATNSLSSSGRSGSGLTPVEVGITLASLLALFLFLLLVGVLCKVFNKPRNEAAPYVQSKLFQPSAAGYGSRTAMQKGMAGASSNSRVSLLGGASPMGYDGRGGDTTADTSIETPSNGSHGQAGDYFGRKVPAGHTRGQSSGVQLPGASVVSSRKGGITGAHPTVNGFGGAPDGAGFTPGKPVNYAGYAGPASYPPKGPGGAALLPPHARVGLGPPPMSDAARRSRYSRAPSRRIDSVGPGQMRKSLYLGADDDPMNSEQYANRRSRMVRKTSTEARSDDPTGGGLRRIDSMGRGDARRKSMAQSTHRASRAASVYTVKGGEKAILLSAQADNFGSGRGDPLGARRNNGPTGNYLSPAPAPRSRSGSNSSSAGPRSNAGSSSPLPSPGLPMSGGSSQPSYGQAYPTRQASDLSQQYSAPRPGQYMPSNSIGGYGAPSPYAQPISNGYPGGGAPRIRPGNPYPAAYNSAATSAYSQAPSAVAAGGYDRAPRQIL